MRILFATFGSLGDLHPVLAVAVELRRRGHEVAVATVAGYREKIGALGLGFHPLRPELSLFDEELVRRIVDSLRGPEFLLRDILLRNVATMHADLAAAAAGADLLVTSELVYAAPILSEQRGLPWISYALAPLSYFSRHDPPVPPVPVIRAWGRALPRPLLGFINSLGKWTTHSWWHPVRELRQQLGLGAGRNPIFEGKYAPLLDLALFSPALQPPQPDWPRQTVQTGFCFFDEAESAKPLLPDPVARFLAAGEPPVVFTLGSSAVHAAGDFYGESARAAAILSRRALLLIGSNPPPPALPANVLAWDYLPYARIFPHASVIVHSGGVGTTAQALRAGRPTLVMPFAFDQFDNAARITRIGAGKTLPRHRYNAAEAARAIAPLLTEKRYAETAGNLGTQVQAEHGVSTACDTIEHALR